MQNGKKEEVDEKEKDQIACTLFVSYIDAMKF